MEIKTKFNVGDGIYFMCGDSPRLDKIKGIQSTFGEINLFSGEEILSDKNIPTITYYTELGYSENENKVFKTKKELMEYVFLNLD